MVMVRENIFFGLIWRDVMILKMCALKIGFIIFAVLIFNVSSISANSENPISHLVKKTLTATARTCMGHVNATEDDLEYLRKDPPFPEKSACIVKCLMEKIGLVKNSKFSKGGFLTAVMPLVIRNPKKVEHMKSVAENCDKEIAHQGATPCQVANEICACVFKYAPELHFKG